MAIPQRMPANLPRRLLRGKADGGTRLIRTVRRTEMIRDKPGQYRA